MNSQDLDVISLAVCNFRKILSKERNPPIAEVIACGVVPKMVALLRDPDASFLADPNLRQKFETIKFESAWALTNIASGSSDQTQMVINEGAVPLFVQMLGHGNPEIQEQAVWAIGNIAGDSAITRNVVLSQGALVPLCRILEAAYLQMETGAVGIKMSMVRNATWTLSNLCRGKNPPPDFELVSAALPILARLLHTSDEEVITDSAWALSYLSDGNNDRIQRIIDNGVVPRLIELLMHPAQSVQTPCLRTVGNIVTGDDNQTQMAINCGLLPSLSSLLSSSKSSIVKETCWTISNITAGTAGQIQSVIDANLIPLLIQILGTADFKVKKEACWAISNATSQKTTNPEQTKYLVDQGCIKPLTDLLASQDTKLITVTLDAIENILEVGDRLVNPETGYNTNPYAQYLEEAGITDHLFALQNHNNTSIYERAYKLIEKYFGEDDEDVEVDVGGNNNGVFGFQQPTAPTGGFNF